MLEMLKLKFPDKSITLIQGSYFDVFFDENIYDAAVSVESLHHFTKEEKLPLYKKLLRSLHPGGYFILTDYFALSDKEEQMHRQTLLRLKAEQSITDNEFYPYAPLTIAHEKSVLKAAKFTEIEVLSSWGDACTIRATKQKMLMPFWA